MTLGKFIVFDGIDYSGKTTITRMVSSWLSDNKINNIITRHPGSTEIGFELRKLLKHNKSPINANAQALLFAADNSLFMHQILKPSIESGKWVIGDRNNFISSLAYQIASGCSIDELDNVHNATIQTYKIDLLFILQCDIDELKRRKAKRNSKIYDRYENTDDDYFNKLIECYNSIHRNHRLKKFVKTKTNGETNVVRINTNQNLEIVMDTIKNEMVKLDSSKFI